jgi:MarR family transcriptional regulator, organic hydroperoxide resistance regulator
MRAGKEQGRALDLSLPQLMLIRTLSEVGEIPVTRWADMIGASPSATTGLLDGLEAAGYVRRTHASDDRRQVLISLLPKGRRLAEGLLKTHQRLWQSYCRGLAPNRLREAADTLDSISARMRTDDAAPARDSPRRRPARAGRA